MRAVRIPYGRRLRNRLAIQHNRAGKASAKVHYIGDRDPQYAEQGLICPRFSLPYSYVEHLDAEALADKQRRGEALVFGHSLGEQIGGQLEAGFVLMNFYEDHQPRPRFVIARYLPTFLATRASKPINAKG